MNPDLLNLMCCPETHQELRFAEPTLIADLNRKIEQKTLTNRAGQPVTEKLDAGLLRADGGVLYPVRGDIPVMLTDEAIPIVT
jgi:uncharacterized protein YbaR (Trm112 family)